MRRERDDAAVIDDAAIDDAAIDDAADIDVEAVSDELEPPDSLADAPGLGLDLPEADALDQRQVVPFDDDDEHRR